MALNFDLKFWADDWKVGCGSGWSNPLANIVGSGFCGFCGQPGLVFAGIIGMVPSFLAPIVVSGLVTAAGASQISICGTATVSVLFQMPYSMLLSVTSASDMALARLGS